MINGLLFVYGTLLDTNNEFACYLVSNSTFYGYGKIKGKLYDIGEYPGVIITMENDYDITGSIYKLNNPEEALIILDDYEGFGPNQAQPNLFIREALFVETVQGIINCWTYLYNQPIDGLVQITPGDYLTYLNQKPS